MTYALLNATELICALLGNGSFASPESEPIISKASLKCQIFFCCISAKYHGIFAGLKYNKLRKVMATLSNIIKKIKKRKGDYLAVSEEIGITYYQLYNLISGRTKCPRWHVWVSLQKWANK